MRIEGIRQERLDGFRRIAADVIWEDSAAPVRTLTIDISEPFASDGQPSPDAVLVALLPIAQWQGERRVRVEGSICCRLREGLATVMQVFGMWHDRCRPVRIEPTRGFVPSVARREPRAAAFLSGGVDALSLLRCNRLDYPSGHPGSIRDCVLLFGLNSYDWDENGPNAQRLAAFQAHRQRLSSLASRSGVALIPIYTNIRTFYPEFSTWGAVGFGAGILSTALCLSSRFDRVHLGSAGLGVRLPPHGSHPLLDHHYSTEAVAVHHAQTSLSRFEKTRIVAGWDDALCVVRSCLQLTVTDTERINCGRCEKCVRTMLALVALGKLGHAVTFPFDDLTPSMLEPIRIEGPLAVPYYVQCIDALLAAGRSDLANPLRRRIDAYHRRERGRGVLGFVRRVSGV